MMEYKVWEEIIIHLFVLCGVRRMTDSEHSLYMADMYSELKNNFTSEEISKAARMIAENENLYGNYPPLSVWLKYCPKRRAEKIAQNKETSSFLSEIESLIDYIPIDYQDLKDTISIVEKNIKKYGARAISVVEQCGGLSRIRETGISTKYCREQILNDIKEMWESSAIDETTGALQISADISLKLENKI